jgi:hypothetical protein
MPNDDTDNERYEGSLWESGTTPEFALDVRAERLEVEILGKSGDIHTYLFLFDFLPALFGFNCRFKSTSSCSRNNGAQSGRPVRSCFCMSLISSSVN